MAKRKKEKTVGALIVRDGQVLLGLRAAHKSGAGCWDIIGGHVKKHEKRRAALAREIAEEIGLTDIDAHRLEKIVPVEPDGSRYVLHVYLVTGWRGEPALLDDEHTELRWFALDEAALLPNLAVDDYPRLFAAAAEHLIRPD